MSTNTSVVNDVLIDGYARECLQDTEIVSTDIINLIEIFYLELDDVAKKPKFHIKKSIFALIIICEINFIFQFFFFPSMMIFVPIATIKFGCFMDYTESDMWFIIGGVFNLIIGWCLATLLVWKLFMVDSQATKHWFGVTILIGLFLNSLEAGILIREFFDDNSNNYTNNNCVIISIIKEIFFYIYFSLFPANILLLCVIHYYYKN